MTLTELDNLLADIRAARVAVVGDVCLDVCWHEDPSRAEASIETGRVTRPVRLARHTPGGATNVAANLAALGCGSVRLFGVLGDDTWGRELLRVVEPTGVDASGCLVQAEGWATQTYVKPHADGEELSRFDFGNFNALQGATADALLRRLEAAIPDVDLVVVNQQALSGIHAPRFRAGLLDLMARHARTPFLADTRSAEAFYPPAGQKMTEHEARRLCGQKSGTETEATARAAAEALFARCRGPVVLTRGEAGCVVRDESGLHRLPAVAVSGPVDTTGAGDVFLGGLAAGMAAGRTAPRAAELGTLAAAVSVQKLHVAGIATADEVRALQARL